MLLLLACASDVVEEARTEPILYEAPGELLAVGLLTHAKIIDADAAKLEAQLDRQAVAEGLWLQARILDTLQSRPADEDETVEALSGLSLTLWEVIQEWPSLDADGAGPKVPTAAERLLANGQFVAAGRSPVVARALEELRRAVRRRRGVAEAAEMLASRVVEARTEALRAAAEVFRFARPKEFDALVEGGVVSRWLGLPL